MLLTAVFLLHVVGFGTAYLRRRELHYLVFSIAFGLLTLQHWVELGPVAAGWLKYPAWTLLGVATYWSIRRRLQARATLQEHSGKSARGR